MNLKLVAQRSVVSHLNNMHLLICVKEQRLLIILLDLFSSISGHYFLLIATHSMLVLEIETLMNLATLRLESQKEKSSSLIPRQLWKVYITNCCGLFLSDTSLKNFVVALSLQGEVAVNRRVDTKSYNSLHTLVHDMFPPMSCSEQVSFSFE